MPTNAPATPEDVKPAAATDAAKTEPVKTEPTKENAANDEKGLPNRKPLRQLIDVIKDYWKGIFSAVTAVAAVVALVVFPPAFLLTQIAQVAALLSSVVPAMYAGALASAAVFGAVGLVLGGLLRSLLGAGSAVYEFCTKPAEPAPAAEATPATETTATAETAAAAATAETTTEAQKKEEPKKLEAPANHGNPATAAGDAEKKAVNTEAPANTAGPSKP